MGALVVHSIEQSSWSFSFWWKYWVLTGRYAGRCSIRSLGSRCSIRSLGSRCSIRSFVGIVRSSLGPMSDEWRVVYRSENRNLFTLFFKLILPFPVKMCVQFRFSWMRRVVDFKFCFLRVTNPSPSRECLLTPSSDLLRVYGNLTR